MAYFLSPAFVIYRYFRLGNSIKKILISENTCIQISNKIIADLLGRIEQQNVAQSVFDKR
jgi:hypothetical protein